MSQNQDPPVNFISHEMAKRLGLVKQENAVESKFPFKKSPDYSKERKSQCVDSFHDASTQKVNYISNEMAKRLGFVKPENAVESTISLEESFDSSEGRNSQFADASIQKVNIISHKVVNRLSSVDQENTLTDTSSISETLTSSEERESQSVNSLHDPLTQENKNNVKRLGFVNQGNTPTDTSSISETLNSSEEREMNMNVVDGVNNDASELHGSRAQTQASHAVDLTHMTYKEFAQKMNMNVVDGVNNDASELHGSHAQNLDGVNALGTQTQTNIVDGVNNHGMGSNTANQSHAVDLTHMTYKEFAQKMNVNVVDGVNNDVSEFHGSQTHVVDGVDNNVMESNIPKDFQIGDRVRVKDFDTRDWEFGVVTQVKPLKAIVDRGLASFAWIFIEHLESTVNSDDAINILPPPVTEERGSTVDKVEDEKDAKTDSTDHSIQKTKKKRGKQAKTKSWFFYVAILTILALGGGITIFTKNYQKISKDEFSKEVSEEFILEKNYQNDNKVGNMKKFIEGIDDDSQNNNDIKDPQTKLQVSITTETKTESNVQIQEHNKNEEETIEGIDDDSKNSNEEKNDIKGIKNEIKTESNVQIQEHNKNEEETIINIDDNSEEFNQKNTYSKNGTKRKKYVEPEYRGKKRKLTEEQLKQRTENEQRRKEQVQKVLKQKYQVWGRFEYESRRYETARYLEKTEFDLTKLLSNSELKNAALQNYSFMFKEESEDKGILQITYKADAKKRKKNVNQPINIYVNWKEHEHNFLLGKDQCLQVSSIVDKTVKGDLTVIICKNKKDE